MNDDFREIGIGITQAKSTNKVVGPQALTEDFGNRSDYGNPVFLATSKYNLQVTMEHWPRVQFDATREHGRTMAQG